MVEEAIAAVAATSSVCRRVNPNASGSVWSDPSALRTRDATCAVPDFFPLGGVAWPEPLLAIWRTMRYSSLVGIFTELSRAWFTVDNKIVLWDYERGREFCVYDEVPELLTVVGNPVRPLQGVFQPHVTYILPVATTTAVFLLGLCLVDEGAAANIKIVNLGYSCTVEAIITKLVCSAGRVFSAAADGNTYELHYMLCSTSVTPKIRMVNYGYLFSSTPVLGQLTSVFNSVREAWQGPRAGLIDIVVDEVGSVLITLDAQSTIAMWRILKGGGLKHMLSLKHNPDRVVPTGISSSDDRSPLVRLFLIDDDMQGCRVLSAALNGDVFWYRYRNPYDIDCSAELVLSSYTPSLFKSNKELGVCYASESVFIAAYSREGDDTSSDDILAITSPRTIMGPHADSRSIVTSLSGVSSRIVRVDAIEKVSASAIQSSNNLCSQVCAPAPTYIVVHRHGLSLYMQARPVDTLYLILSSADAQNQESLLSRFSAAYRSPDYVAMLLQIAIGGLHVHYHRPQTFVGDFSFTSTSGDGTALSELGKRLLTADNAEAQRQARELLRLASLSPTQSVTGGIGAANSREVEVLMSPFAVGLFTFVGRAVSHLWNVPISKVRMEQAAVTAEVLGLLIQFLDTLSLGSLTEQQLKVDIPHEWRSDKVVCTIASSSTLSAEDVNRLQMLVLYHCYGVAHKSLQLVTLLRVAQWTTLESSDAMTTFGQVIGSDSVARRIGSFLSRVVLSSQQGTGVAMGDRAASFIQVQRRCPYFFDASSSQEFQVQSEIDALTQGDPFHSYSEARMMEWTAKVRENAATYWASGALQNVCQQLNSMKREDVAVELLLHAGSQLDPNNLAFNTYLAEKSRKIGEVTQDLASSSMYQSKIRVLELIVRTLESAWLTHRSVVDRLLGGPRKSGAIWQFEPSDELSHCFLFDWMCAPRDDAALSQRLRDTVVFSRSIFLASYLRRNATVLAEEYVHFLSRVQGDYKAAMEQSIYIAQTPLSNIPTEERLSYRLRCLREALDCALKCQSDQTQQVEHRLQLLVAQQQLYHVVTGYINEGGAQLERRWDVDGQLLTEKEIAAQHAAILLNSVATATDLIEIAGAYPSRGGAEVQLDVLLCFNVSDVSAYALCLRSAYQHQGESVDDITSRMIDRYFNKTSYFPLAFLVRLLEARVYAKAPWGSAQTIRLLIGCGVDLKVLFVTYHSILEEKDNSGLDCREYIDSGVTRAFMTHSLAVLLVDIAESARRGAIQQWMLTNAMTTVQNAVTQVKAECKDGNEMAAIEAAGRLLRLVDHTVAGSGALF